jgi:hypothetical protein
MALFGLVQSPTVDDPDCGRLIRSRGYWRGRMALGAHPDVALLIGGGREGPDGAALAQARELPARYLTLQSAIGAALFEHYGPYREAVDAGEIDEDAVQLASSDDVWAHVKPVHIIIAPLDGRLTVEIGYATEWDIEHTLGARLVDWQLAELNGSVLGIA